MDNTGSISLMGVTADDECGFEQTLHSLFWQLYLLYLCRTRAAKEDCVTKSNSFPFSHLFRRVSNPSARAFIGPLIAFFAFILAIIGSFRCDFVSISVSLASQSYSLGLGIWY
jgi:hypothetical protein